MKNFFAKNQSMKVCTRKFKCSIFMISLSIAFIVGSIIDATLWWGMVFWCINILFILNGVCGVLLIIMVINLAAYGLITNYHEKHNGFVNSIVPSIGMIKKNHNDETELATMKSNSNDNHNARNRMYTNR